MLQVVTTLSLRRITCAFATMLMAILPALMMVSCGSKDGGDDADGDKGYDHHVDSAAVAIYSLYIHGKYAEYVKQVESNDAKPKEYREQMAILYKVRHRQQEEENGGPVKCQLLHFEPHGDNYGIAFLEVTYKNKTKETILQQMVKVNDRWRVR